MEALIPSHFGLFLLATLVLLVVPGPAVMFIVARSVDQGLRAGIASTLGIAVGTLFHVAASGLGLSALLVSSADAFRVWKLAGAVYLIWLGVRRWRERDVEAPGAAPPRAPLGRLFRQGVWVNVLNPKTAAFFFAFLPQFVDASRGNVAAQAVFLGLVFVALGVLSDGAWAMTAGWAASRLRGNARFLAWRRRVTGGTYVALGLAAALSGNGRK
jgi:threonine/homoserine/homoserine lactone efflux protein